MKKFLNEFKQFATRGNVIDLAVGIIIGAAFPAIVNSLVNDLVNPFIGIFTAGVAFDELVIPLAGSEDGIRIGAFLNAVLEFLIIAFVVFMLVKAVNKVANLKKKEEEPATPARSSRSSSASPSTPRKEKLTLPGSRFSRQPLSRTSGTRAITPAIRRSRSRATCAALSARFSVASPTAMPSPTIPGRFSVPARRPRSCAPPWMR